MIARLLAVIFLINISLESTLTTNKYFNFVKAINKNDFETVSLIFSSLSLPNYSQRIEDCITIKNKLICKKTSLKTELNLGYDRTKEMKEVNLMLEKIEKEEKKAWLAKNSDSCCCMQ